MIVDIQTYLDTLFNSALVDEDLIIATHQSGLINYVFKRETIEIKPLHDQYKKYLNYNSDIKEYIMLSNIVLNDKININDIVFKDVKQITVIGQKNTHVINTTPIKVKNLLIAIRNVITNTISPIKVRNIHEVPFTNELIINIG